MSEKKEDVLVQLWRAAALPDVDQDERLLLMKAAETIETLRTLIGIVDEMELEDMEPEGRA